MTKRTGLVLIAVLFAAPAFATSWGYNNYSHVVGWSHAIIVAKVKTVDRIDRPKSDEGTHLGKATMTVEVMETLKGEVAPEIQVYDLDLGGKGRDALYAPMPEPLVGRVLFLCLLNEATRHGPYKAFGQGLVEKDAVRGARFALWEEKSLREIRAITTEMQLLLRVFPRGHDELRNDAAELGAFQVGLRSEYEDVVWWATLQLYQRKNIPESLLDDLMKTAKRLPGSMTREGVLKCIGKVGRLRAVPFLIEVLRSEPQEVAAAQALKELTGEEFGKDVEAWQRWWEKHRPR
jgi:hypothetical protein